METPSVPSISDFRRPIMHSESDYELAVESLEMAVEVPLERTAIDT